MTWLPPEVVPYFVGLGGLIFTAFGFDAFVAFMRRGHAEVTEEWEVSDR